MIQSFTVKRILLSLIILILTGLPVVSHASCEVTLQLDTSNQGAEGYQVFGREEGQDFDYEAPWWQGDSSFDRCTIDDLDENKTYYFVARAFSGDDVSGDSNEVRFAYGDRIDGGQSGSGCFLDSLFHG